MADSGRVSGPFANLTLLVLHTTGAESGEPRVNPAATFVIDGYEKKTDRVIPIVELQQR